jgi:hypothetical protein
MVGGSSRSPGQCLPPVSGGYVGPGARAGQSWHETYLVKAGQYEAVYGNMPARGLGKAGRLVPMSERSRARERLGAVTV